MKQNKLLMWFRGLLFPPKCPVCRSFLRQSVVASEKGIFCESCEKAWHRSRFERCGRCGMEYRQCLCQPYVLARYGSMGLCKLLPYEKMRETVGKRSVLFMKKHNKNEVFRFFGTELAKILRVNYPDSAEGRAVVTYVPRSHTAVNRFGFDQSRLLAKEVARALDAAMLSVFRRKRWGIKEQKHLRASERRKNMRRAFRPHRQAMSRIEQAKIWILVDDVVTTGASMAGCLDLLPEALRHKCVCAAVGITPLSQKQEK